MRVGDIKKRLLRETPELDLKMKRDLAFQISKHIELARLTKGFTQKKLAQQMGTQQSNIARAENSKSLPNLSFLQRMAEAFDSYLVPPKFAFMEDRTAFKVLNSNSLKVMGGWNVYEKTIFNASQMFLVTSEKIGAPETSETEISSNRDKYLV